MFTLLCLVRKIQVFAKFHVFANAMIVITVLVVIAYGIKEIGEDDVKTPVPAINQFGSAIGFSAYSFEGIGLILPVEEITQDKKVYKKIVMLVVFTCCVVYLGFGYFCVQAWESKINTPLITD